MVFRMVEARRREWVADFDWLSRRAGSLDRLRRIGCAVCLIAVVSLAPALAQAEDNDRLDLAKEAGMGAGTALVNLVYSPVKLAYAFGGLVVGGLAWAFSGGDAEVAEVVLTPSLRGNYVLTPAQLEGKREIEFFGRKPKYRDGWENGGKTPKDDRDVAAAPEGKRRW